MVMKAKVLLITLIGIFSMLSMSVKAQDGDSDETETIYVGKGDNVNIGNKPQHSPRKNTAKTTLDVLYIKFTSDVSDVTISIYKDGVEVVNNYEGDVSYGTVLPFYLSQYGVGTYEVYVLSAVDIIASGEMEVVEQ